MCLITFRYNYESEYPFVLIANRDENYARESAAIHQWEDKPDIYGGRDLQAGGAWLAFNKNGRFAALTNQPFTHHEPVELISRGTLITNYLEGQTSAREYADSLRNNRMKYDGYQLLFGTIDELYLYNNISDDLSQLNHRIHSISNTKDDLSSFRQRKSEEELAELTSDLSQLNLDKLIEVFQDEEVNPHFENYPSHLEKDFALGASSIFIRQNDEFGTVSTTAILVNRAGEVEMKEIKYDPKKVIKETELEFKIEI